MMKVSVVGLLMMFVLCSCGIQAIVVKTTAPIIGQATYAVETENNWDNFRRGVPGNLTLMEGLLYLDKENEKLLASLIKGYAAYAYIIDETLYLDDKLSDNDKIRNLNQAIYNYARAFKFGQKYLRLNDISYKQLMARMNEPGGIEAILDDELSDSRRNLESVLFMAHALGSLINLQRSDMALIAQLPVAKGMFDWVCKKDPNINFNTCDIFYGYYEASRPRMLGGNPQRGKKIFLDLINKSPDNWLARTAYIQYYLIPMMDEDGYEKQKRVLNKLKKTHYEDLKWSPSRIKRDDAFVSERLRVYQTLAIKRFEIIVKNEEEIF